MHSTLPSDLILKVENLGLVFRTHLYQTPTLRDAFVQTLKNPLKNLLQAKNRHIVLDGLNLKVRRGDRVALMGVNGVGKTSLCRCITGIYRPTKGTIKVNGQVRAIFDTAVGIFPELTGRENAYVLSRFLYPNEDDKTRKELIEEALAFSELKSFLDMPYKNYSNGMQARLCLSVISCKPCDLLILDEVFEGADQFFREKIAKRVLDMIEKSGAVIFVSHSEQQVMRVCNRAVLLKHGQVIFDGAPASAVKAYSDPGFITQ